MKRAIFVLLIVAAIGAGAGAYYIRRNGPEVQVNTSPVTRGDIVDTVAATGVVQPVTTVQVGSQVSGTIQFLGADFNSIVRKGQVIARLDPSLFQTQVEQARANLTRARADTERARVALDDAQTKYARARELAARSLLPQSELDAAKVNVDVARAQLQSAEAQVVQAQASLRQAEVNLQHTIITAPIDGIVTSRNVDVGQTVAASLQSPTLFVIAADLTKMQVNANIDESDVGRIRPGQRVSFHVDAYPTEEFEGTVVQVRLQPVVVQNVTTYGTVIDVPNRELKLKPGMTANVKIEIAKRTDVVRVPTAALRFRPTTDMFAALNQPIPPEMQPAGGRAGRQGGGVERQPDTAALPTPTPSSEARGGRGGGGGRGDGSGRGDGGGGRRAQMMERLQSLPPAERQQMLERMKARGVDVGGFDQRPAQPDTGEPAAPPKATRKTTAGAPPPAQTIDALFAPLPTVETRGRAWLYMNNQLKPVNLRLGISDGTYTELLSGELQPGMELVTGILIGGVRTTSAPGGSGNPLMPGRGGGFGGGQGRGR